MVVIATLITLNCLMIFGWKRPASIQTTTQLGSFTNIRGLFTGGGTGAHPPFVLPVAWSNTTSLPSRMTELPGYLDRAATHSIKSATLLFEVSVRTAAMRLEGEFRDIAAAKFAKAPGGLAALERQPIISVRNRVTEEMSIFNEIRRFRPGYTEGITPEDDAAVQKLYDETTGADKCDFCSVNRTALDVFGRIESMHCYTASNIAKYEKWHSLLVGRNHNPLDFSVDILHDYLLTAKKWFQAVNSRDPSVAFPFASWDIGPRGSASQLHTHLQMAITPTRYFYRAERLRKDSALFEQMNLGANYFTELVKAHIELGLAEKVGDHAVVLSYLSPIKEKEIIILTTNDGSLDFARALNVSLSVLKEDFGVRALSLGFIFQPLSPTTKDEHFAETAENVALQLRGYPGIIRIVDRGAMFDKRADVGAMEFFGSNNVGADPFAIMPMLRRRLNSH